MRKDSYAKINLALNVINNSKPKEYHDLDMVNFTISLKDTIWMSINTKEPSNKTVITSNNEKIPTGKENLVYQVVEKFKKENKLSFDCNIHIKKRIPLEAGLGGGSSNAACVLHMLDKYFKTNLTTPEKASFLESITADGPYMAYSTPCRVRGFGDLILPFMTKFKYKVLLVKPKSGCNTKEIYDSLNYKKMARPDIDKLVEALKENNYEEVSQHIGNSLLGTATTQNREIKEILTRLKTCGFQIISLSGSGSTCFAISNKKYPFEHAKQIFNNKEKYELVKVFKIR